MDFSIVTQDQYIHVTVHSPELDNSLLEALTRALPLPPSTKEDSQDRANIILDLKNCTSAAPGITGKLLELHQKQYGGGHSFVITQAGKEVAARLRDEDPEEMLQRAPSFQEALDIVHMEILERDLLREE